MPEIKQGKIVAGDPAELDVLTLKKRRPGGELLKSHFYSMDSTNVVFNVSHTSTIFFFEVVDNTRSPKGPICHLGALVCCVAPARCIKYKVLDTPRPPKGNCNHVCCVDPTHPVCKYVRVSCVGCKQPGNSKRPQSQYPNFDIIPFSIKTPSIYFLFS